MCGYKTVWEKGERGRGAGCLKHTLTHSKTYMSSSEGESRWQRGLGEKIGLEGRAKPGDEGAELQDATGNT